MYQIFFCSISIGCTIPLYNTSQFYCLSHSHCTPVLVSFRSHSGSPTHLYRSTICYTRRVSFWEVILLKLQVLRRRDTSVPMASQSLLCSADIKANWNWLISTYNFVGRGNLSNRVLQFFHYFLPFHSHDVHANWRFLCFH